jgi:allantoinase
VEAELPPRDTASRAARALERCDLLAACTEEPGRITRPFATSALARAQAAVTGWMRAAGMNVRPDAIGNLRARLPGMNAQAPALLLGSHLDSVRDAGKYDGPLGILIALAAVERLAATGRRLPFPVEIVAFPDEEGLRFQTTYLGSAALAGTFDPALLDLVDAGGVSMREAIAAAGGQPEAIAAAALREDEAFAYVEVHIEQGPHLESVSAPLGVVTAISGQTRILASFTGEAGHAGTVSMALRRDPLPAAAELILAAERLAREKPGLLATVGKIDAAPGASNVIPGRVELTLDVRHPEDAVRSGAVYSLELQTRQIATKRSLDLDWRVMRDHPAVPCDPALADRLARAVEASELPVERLPSGAGHDAVVMSTRLPVAMLFVRCAGGVSHNPAESVTAPDVQAAIDVIDRFLEALAGEAEQAEDHSPPVMRKPARQFDLIVRGGSVVGPDDVLVADIAIEDGRIVEVSQEIAGNGRQEIDAAGLHVLPGAVDIHVHFNEPGRTDWEGWASGSLAAATGGTTTVADMPLNAHPPTLDGPAFDAKRAAAEASSIVDFALWGGLTPINLDRMEELAARGVIGFKAFMSDSGIEDFPRADDATLREGMARAAALGLPVAVHAEDETLTATLAARARAAGKRSFAAYAATRPPEAEIEAIGRAICFAEETGCALHVVHVSTAAGVAEVDAARARGVDVTAETCPHYLYFSEDDVDLLGPLAKCAPPLRTYVEQQRLLQAVARGEVQIIASDHSPCPEIMKLGENDFFEIWGGIAGCQSLMPAMIGIGHLGQQMPLASVVSLFTAAPARRLRLAGKGQIAPGFDADLVLVNLAEQFTLEPWHLRYRHEMSPYVNFTFPASVRRVVLRGQTIVLDNEFLGPPRGRLLTPAARDAL